MTKQNKLHGNKLPRGFPEDATQITSVSTPSSYIRAGERLMVKQQQEEAEQQRDRAWARFFIRR